MLSNTRTTASSPAARHAAAGISASTKPADSCALWDAEKAARYLGMTPGWLAKLRMTGGPRYVKMQRRVYYRRTDLDAWINARVISSTSQQTEAVRSGIS